MLRLYIAFSCLILCSESRFGPDVIATKGEVWPKPQQQQKTEQYYIIRPHSFNFEAKGNVNCPDFLNAAFERYWNIIAAEQRKVKNGRDSWNADENLLGDLTTLTVELTGECPNEGVYPAFGDNENYTLTISESAHLLSSPSIWGILRGLETFSQLVHSVDDMVIINATDVVDFPRFPHRGFLLDTSRHYQPMDIIFKLLDAMVYNKLNVFHWHVVDDSSFPYQSRAFPDLSLHGAYHPTAMIYTMLQVKAVIEYARLRGIRVIPEFDTPGHTRSWGEARPELLTPCYSGEAPNGELGPMDLSKDTTFTFLGELFAEVVDTFPDEYFHIGGDEVDFSCWKSNPDISAFMTAQNLTDYVQLESYFIQKVVDILDGLSSKYLVWEEVFVNGVNLPASTVVHVWKGNGLNTINAVTKAGKFGLFSSGWYLSDLASGGDWVKYYRNEPLNFDGSEEQKALVLGGEVCMWGEYVNRYSVVPRVWPRASAAAERLWSAQTVTEEGDAKRRLEEHTCRMNRRGIAAQPPNGPGVCL